MLGRFASHFAASPVSFEIVLPDKTVQRFGSAEPGFRVKINSRQGLRAIRSVDEGEIAEAYLAGDIDIEGDMLRPFELRVSMKDFHPLIMAWRFIQPLLFGQVHTNKRAISAHYDMDPQFFLSFLDPATPYTQGVYEIQTKRSAPQRFGNLSIALKSLSLKPAITFSKSARAGELGLSTRRSGEFAVPGSVIRRCQLIILAAGRDSLGLIGS